MIRCRAKHCTIRCELRHGHRGRHRSGETRWTSTRGPVPFDGTGYTVIRHLRLTAAQAEAQDAAAGTTPWAAWAREKLVAAIIPILEVDVDLVDPRRFDE